MQASRPDVEVAAISILQPHGAVWPSPPKDRKGMSAPHSPPRPLPPTTTNSNASSLAPSAYISSVHNVRDTLGFKGGDSSSQHLFRPLQPFLRSVSQHNTTSTAPRVRSSSKPRLSEGKGGARGRSSKRSVVSSLRKALVEATSIHSDDVNENDTSASASAAASKPHTASVSVGIRSSPATAQPWSGISTYIPPPQLTNTFHAPHTVHQAMMAALLNKRYSHITHNTHPNHSRNGEEDDCSDDGVDVGGAFRPPSASDIYWELSDLPEYEHDLLASIRYAVASLSSFESMLPKHNLDTTDDGSDDPVLAAWEHILCEATTVIHRVEEEMARGQEQQPLSHLHRQNASSRNGKDISFLGTNGSGVEYIVAACVQQQHIFIKNKNNTDVSTNGSASVVGSKSGVDSPYPTSFLLQQALDNGSVLAQCELGLLLIARAFYLRWKLSIPIPSSSSSTRQHDDADKVVAPEDLVEEGIMRTPPPDPPEVVEQDAICPFALRLLDRAAMDLKYPGAMLQISLLMATGGIEPYMRVGNHTNNDTGNVHNIDQNDDDDKDAVPYSEGEEDEDSTDEEEEEEELSWQWWLSESCALDFAPAFVVSAHRMLYPSCFTGSVAVPLTSSSAEVPPTSIMKYPWRASTLTSTLRAAKTAAELGDMNAQFFLGKLLLSMAASGSAVIKLHSNVHQRDLSDIEHQHMQLASCLFFEMLAVSPIPTPGASTLSPTQLAHLSTSVLPEFQQAKLRGLYWLREASQGGIWGAARLLEEMLHSRR